MARTRASDPAVVKANGAERPSCQGLHCASSEPIGTSIIPLQKFRLWLPLHFAGAD